VNLAGFRSDTRGGAPAGTTIVGESRRRAIGNDYQN
jgi:hypothetical protein